MYRLVSRNDAGIDASPSLSIRLDANEFREGDGFETMFSKGHLVTSYSASRLMTGLSIPKAKAMIAKLVRDGAVKKVGRDLYLSSEVPCPQKSMPAIESKITELEDAQRLRRQQNLSGFLRTPKDVTSVELYLGVSRTKALSALNKLTAKKKIFMEALDCKNGKRLYCSNKETLIQTIEAMRVQPVDTKRKLDRFLSSPRTVSEVAAFAGKSATWASLELSKLSKTGKLHSRKVGLQKFFCSQKGALQSIDPSSAKLNNRRRQSKTKAGDDLLVQFLEKPRSIHEIDAYLGVVRSSVLIRLRRLADQNRIHKAQAGHVAYYCTSQNSLNLTIAGIRKKEMEPILSLLRKPGTAEDVANLIGSTKRTANNKIGDLETAGLVVKVGRKDKTSPCWYQTCPAQTAA